MSVLEQGKKIVAAQPEDSLHAGVSEEGAEVAVNKTLVSGWSAFAWFQQRWDKTRHWGAGLLKKF